MFSPRSSMLLLLALFIPFLLRFFGEEPYPAVLLPSSAGTIQKNGQFTIEHTRLFGIKNKGTWEELNEKLFFDPIPFQQASTILANNLGLGADSLRRNTRKAVFYNKLGIFPNRKLTAGQLLELKKWIKNKLSNQHFATSRIRLTEYKETISIQTGTITNSEIKNENIYALD